MPPNIAVCLAISIALFSVIAAHGFGLRRSGDVQGFWGAMLLSLMPATISVLLLSSDGDISMHAKTIALGVIGGAVGSVMFIWLGHVIASAQTSTGIAPPAVSLGTLPSQPPLPPGPTSSITSQSPSNSVTSAEIDGHNQGGNAATISNGSPNGVTSIGADIQANGCAGQEIIGLHVTQSGSGTGLHVVQSGPGIGLRVITNVGGPNCPK